jgi:hypothetical protein
LVRSPIEINVAAGQPSDLIIEMNMQDLARYALICQAEGLVPIVEPDVSLKGDHDLATAVAINTKIQATLFKAMLDHGVYMEGAVLKSNIVNPGKSCPTPYTAEQIGQANLDVFRRYVARSLRLPLPLTLPSPPRSPRSVCVREGSRRCSGAEGLHSQQPVERSVSIRSILWRGVSPFAAACGAECLHSQQPVASSRPARPAPPAP